MFRRGELIEELDWFIRWLLGGFLGIFYMSLQRSVLSLSWLWRVKVPPSVIAFGLFALTVVFLRWITVVDGE